jgi:hypothetical protein
MHAYQQFGAQRRCDSEGRCGHGSARKHSQQQCETPIIAEGSPQLQRQPATTPSSPQYAPPIIEAGIDHLKGYKALWTKLAV